MLLDRLTRYPLPFHKHLYHLQMRRGLVSPEFTLVCLYVINVSSTNTVSTRGGETTTTGTTATRAAPSTTITTTRGTTATRAVPATTINENVAATLSEPPSRFRRSSECPQICTCHPATRMVSCSNVDKQTLHGIPEDTDSLYVYDSNHHFFTPTTFHRFIHLRYSF